MRIFHITERDRQTYSQCADSDVILIKITLEPPRIEFSQIPGCYGHTDTKLTTITFKTKLLFIQDILVGLISIHNPAFCATS